MGVKRNCHFSYLGKTLISPTGIKDQSSFKLL